MLFQGDFKWKQCTTEQIPELAYCMKRLKEGAMYEFRVAAENKAGVGPFSDPTEPIKCKEPVSKFILPYIQFCILLPSSGYINSFC